MIDEIHNDGIDKTKVALMMIVDTALLLAGSSHLLAGVINSLF